MAELPPMAPAFDVDRFLGTWHILLTSYAFWRARTHPTVTYERLPDDSRVALRDTLRFRKRPLLGGAPRPAALVGVDVQDPARPAHFIWRGAGLLRVIRSPWYVVAVGDGYDWAITYFARSNVGTAAGVDLYARGPSLPPEQVDALVERIRRDPFLAPHASRLFATVRGE